MALPAATASRALALSFHPVGSPFDRPPSGKQRRCLGMALLFLVRLQGRMLTVALLEGSCCRQPEGHMVESRVSVGQFLVTQGHTCRHKVEYMEPVFQLYPKAGLEFTVGPRLLL